MKNEELQKHKICLLNINLKVVKNISIKDRITKLGILWVTLSKENYLPLYYTKETESYCIINKLKYRIENKIKEH